MSMSVPQDRCSAPSCCCARRRCSPAASRASPRRARRSSPIRRASRRSAARSPRSSMRSARRTGSSRATPPASIRRSALKLPDVGYMRALSPEGVLSVNPTGILALAGQRPEGSRRRAEEGRASPMSTCPRRFDQRASSTRSGSSARRSAPRPRPTTLAAEVEAELKAAEALTRRQSRAQARAVHPSRARRQDPCLGQRTAADGIIALAGGVNAVEAFRLQAAYRRSGRSRASPDVILMMDRGGDHAARPRLSCSPIRRSPRRRPARRQQADPHGRRLSARLRPAHRRRGPRSRRRSMATQIERLSGDGR